MGMMRKKADTALTKSDYDMRRLRTTRQTYSQCNGQINKQLLRQAKETVNQSLSNKKIVVSLHTQIKCQITTLWQINGLCLYG